MSFNKEEYKKQWYFKNKDRLAKRNKEYRLENKESLSQKRKEKYLNNKNKYKEQQLSYARNSSENYVYYRARNNSKRKELDFNIEISDVIIPIYCPYLNEKLSLPRDKANPEFVPSLDRINSNLGYVKNNVRVISDKANRMKRNSTEEELIQFAKGVLKLHAGIDIDKILTEFEQLQQVQGLCKD